MCIARFIPDQGTGATYACTRVIQKVSFPILFLLKGFLHRVGTHGSVSTHVHHHTAVA